MAIEPVRVLQVSDTMVRGGLETMLMNYYRNIDRSKVQFDFLVHYPTREAYEDEIESMGGRIYRVQNIRLKKIGRYLKEVGQFLNKHKEYKIMHSHLDTRNSFPLMAAKKAGIPVRIAHSHCSVFLEKGTAGLLSKFSRAILKAQCTEFFACSEQAGNFLFGEALVRAGQVTIMKNAIDTGKFKFNVQAREKIRREFGLGEKFVIGHVGNFYHMAKNQTFLIDIFYEIQKKEPESALLFIGFGPLMKDAEEKARRMGISDKVIFTGSRHNVNEFMSAMDVYAMPSLSEGMPVTSIEAQAADLPVVVARCVPKEAAITDLLSYMALEEGASAWAGRILSYKDSRLMRGWKGNEVASRVYGIKENAKWLQDFYLSGAVGRSFQDFE